jgi:hypothetical protein
MGTKLIKSKQRVKDAGEVFTPSFLVEKMLDGFPPEAWSKDKNWLEPTCGNGNFILGIINRKIDKRFSFIEAVNTTFGMDIMEDNIVECRQRIYQQAALYDVKRDLWAEIVCIVSNNIVLTKNSLDENWNEKFRYFRNRSPISIEKSLQSAERALKQIVDVSIAASNIKNINHKPLLAFRKDFRISE